MKTKLAVQSVASGGVAAALEWAYNEEVSFIVGKVYNCASVPNVINFHLSDSRILS
jgi:hypothetical protein